MALVRREREVRKGRCTRGGWSSESGGVRFVVLDAVSRASVLLYAVFGEGGCEEADGDGDGSVVSNHNVVAGESFEIGNGWYARAQRLAGKLKIEQRGIERVPEDERTDAGFKALLNVATMWLSANVRIILTVWI